VLRESIHQSELRSKVDEVIKRDFAAARDYATTLEEHRKVFEFGNTWNIETYSSSKKCAAMWLVNIVQLFSSI
jgi:hypothetical protein